MTRYLNLRASDRVELEDVVSEVLVRSLVRKIRTGVETAVEMFCQPANPSDDRIVIPEGLVDTILGVIESNVEHEVGYRARNASPISKLVDELGRRGWRLLASGSLNESKDSLSRPVRSVRTRRRRVKRVRASI